MKVAIAQDAAVRKGEGSPRSSAVTMPSSVRQQIARWIGKWNRFLL